MKPIRAGQVVTKAGIRQEGQEVKNLKGETKASIKNKTGNTDRKLETRKT